MRVNIFAGARRLALLAAILVTLVTAVLVWNSEPYISLSYTIAAPGMPARRTSESCPDSGAQHYFTTRTSAGKNIGVDLCFLPADFGKAGQLVQYRVEPDGTYWGAPLYSTEVSAYESETENAFRLPSQDDHWANKELSRQRWKTVREAVIYWALGLAAFWLVVWAIGWVIRGFAGIPLGKDERASRVAGEP